MGICCCKQRSDPIEALRQSPLGQCSHDTLKALVKYLEYETFAKGTELYSSQNKSDEPRKIFFICEGKKNFLSLFPKGGKKSYDSYGKFYIFTYEMNRVRSSLAEKFLFFTPFTQKSRRNTKTENVKKTVVYHF